MTAHVSSVEDLALHGPRVLGYADAGRVASRYDLDVAQVEELLLDYAAFGWVRHSEFAGSSGWSMTDSGRAEDERRMREELDAAGVRESVTEAHAAFVPLNRRFGRACTAWQIRPERGDPMAANDHTDWAWDERVLRTLAGIETQIGDVCGRLADALARFEGYAERYARARARVEGGRREWVDSIEVDSCHLVWIQLHEDLLSTLGIPRGSDA